ncbi:S8 family peptidase [Actinomadura luteofluorescens]|uniref:S8 family peptidase n=1 Tax=Actinomadura luteofluorescens TaxID=46163 RepID=UPI0034770B04
MTEARRSILALGAPEVGQRIKQSPAPGPQISRPSAARQGERLSPQFRTLVEAFESKRAQLSDGHVDEVDPELVLVFDLAGSVKDFQNAINRIDGLEFLAEFLEDEAEPDEDFHMGSRQDDPSDDMVQRSLYLVMSNAAAVSQLLRLFEQWQADPAMTFDRGLGKFRGAFEHLRAIRRWSAADRVRDTGLIQAWRDRLELVGQSVSSVRVEIELWYRHDAEQRMAAETHVAEIIGNAGGRIRDRTQIREIAYHALLADLPVQQVHAVLGNGAEAIQLLTTDEVMFVTPYTPMSVGPSTLDSIASRSLPAASRVSGRPRIALLDGLPFVNHDVLVGRLTVDDPDEVSRNYPVSSRHHGTAMASLIIHGDLSAPGESLDRPLYVRPIMQPHEALANSEHVIPDLLLTDLLHRAVRRIVEGESGREPTAPSVRIINLSIGAESRALVRRMSPPGRLLDWLAVKYNLLFVVSSGNHRAPISIPAEAATQLESTRSEALKAARNMSRLRGILPPGDAINALTVGALHDDSAGEIDVPDTVWDITRRGMPALYGAVGPGVRRSIKPDLNFAGGRALYTRPVVVAGDDMTELQLAPTAGRGPGTQVAAPGRGGETDTSAFSYGTSNATALVTREASRIFDVLEAGADGEDSPFPNALYHPVLAKALLVHATSWGRAEGWLRNVLGLDPQRARRELTALLGYGALDVGRLGVAATNRAVLIAGGLIGREERHTYDVPLPSSLQSRAEWHRFTVTLAYMAPTVTYLTRYRGARVYFEKLDERLTGGKRIGADHHAVRRGNCQHEIIEGRRAMAFGVDDSLPIHVQCMDDAQRLLAGRKIRYGLVVSVETAAETSTTIHDEIRAQLQVRTRVQTRPRS